MWEHWSRYGREQEYPPWVFQSPCGALATRELLTGIAIAVLAIAVVPLFLIEATVPGPIPGNGLAALAANWEAFCRHHYVPLVESLIEEHYAPLIQMLTLPIVAGFVSAGYFLLRGGNKTA